MSWWVHCIFRSSRCVSAPLQRRDRVSDGFRGLGLSVPAALRPLAVPRPVPSHVQDSISAPEDEIVFSIRTFADAHGESPVERSVFHGLSRTRIAFPPSSGIEDRCFWVAYIA